MERLPIEIWREIHSFVNPIGDLSRLKYKRSVVWCQQCGEKLRGGDWFLYMNDDTVIVSYTCIGCAFENVYDQDDDWTTLVDYANEEYPFES